MWKTGKKISFVACVLTCLLLLGCSRGERFTISGTIEGMDSSAVVYLEQMTLPRPTLVDSAKVGKKGTLRFRAPKPEYPDIYQLRMGRQRFIFAVDSTEHITFSAGTDSLFCPREIGGSEHSRQINSLRRSVRHIDSLCVEYTKQKATAQQIEAAVEQHKDMATAIVMSDPRSVVAYYALFQQVNGFYVYSPYDKQDRKICAAVATAYNAFMPGYYRSKNIYSLVLEAIQEQRREQNNERLHDFINQTGTGFIDIRLNDIAGNEVSLSSFVGRPILLEFTMLTAEGSAEHNLELRDAYQQLHSKAGLEVYQVAMDRSELLWQQTAKALPWTSVRDADQYYAKLYNISRLPTNFLIDAGGNIIERDISLERLKRKLSR